MKPAREYQLSVAGNHDEFSIPETPLGDEICKLPLGWGWVEGTLQACIKLKGVHYPSFRPATRKEIKLKAQSAQEI